jgi:hypothetical protein
MLIEQRFTNDRHVCPHASRLRSPTESRCPTVPSEGWDVFVAAPYASSCVAIYARTIREFPELSRPLELVAYLLGTALLVIVATPFVSQAAFRKHMLAPGGAFLSPQTIELSPASISVASVRGDTILPWSGVLALDQDETNYYLFIDTMQALVVPRAAIAPVAAEFEQYTRHLRHAA